MAYPSQPGAGTIPPPEPPTEVERFISNMLSAMITEDRAIANEFTNDAGWAAAEIDHWKSRCEELEIEIECMRNEFFEHDNDIQPKRRGLFS